MLVSPAGACWVAGACRKPKHEKTPTSGLVLHMVAGLHAALFSIRSLFPRASNEGPHEGS